MVHFFLRVYYLIEHIWQWFSQQTGFHRKCANIWTVWVRRTLSRVSHSRVYGPWIILAVLKWHSHLLRVKMGCFLAGCDPRYFLGKTKKPILYLKCNVCSPLHLFHLGNPLLCSCCFLISYIYEGNIVILPFSNIKWGHSWHFTTHTATVCLCFQYKWYIPCGSITHF